MHALNTPSGSHALHTGRAMIAIIASLVLVLLSSVSYLPCFSSKSYAAVIIDANQATQSQQAPQDGSSYGAPAQNQQSSSDSSAATGASEDNSGSAVGNTSDYQKNWSNTVGNVVGKDGTDIDTSQAPQRLMKVISRLVMIMIPLLMVACVAIIIGNAVRNMFVKKEERVKIGDLLKNIIVNFFWIFAAPIAIELIVFIVTNGEVVLFDAILG